MLYIKTHFDKEPNMKRTLRIILIGLAIASSANPAAGLEDVFAITSVKGGLVVHLGCGDGKLTAALHANKSFIVHGLDTSAANVAKARKHVRSLGLYGPVSVAVWNGRTLPYADNLVNLLVAENLGKTPMAEVMRVLVPNGVAYINGRKTVKPRPADIDDWSHFLHDASNNAVANDTKVSPPRRLKWVCGPLWARSHEFNSSLCALISAGGRAFYIFDEGLTGVTPASLPERWTLIARDAFNGTLLWKRPMPQWGTAQWRSRGLRNVPLTVMRRIVAEGDRLFVTLGYDAPVSILDAATGKVLAICEGSEGAQELRCSDGVILLRKGQDTVMAFDAKTARKLWQAKAGVNSLSLAAWKGKVFYQVGSAVICHDLPTGKKLWQTAEPASPAPAAPPRKPGAKRGKKPRRSPSSLVIVHDGHVLFNGPQGLHAVAAETGKTLWIARGQRLGSEPFVAGGYIWQRQGRGIAGLDLATGKSKKQVNADDVFTPGHHPRCYQSKATVNYIITPNRGIEFVSLTGQKNTQHDWTRGACRYGIMPGNGLLYVPPDPCFCYPGVKLTGFNALEGGQTTRETASGSRLEKGPAYGTIGNGKLEIGNPQAWPAYRHDARRTGAATCEVSSKVAPEWTVRLTGRLTPPVAAGGLLYVAEKDAHTLHAIKLADGSAAWQFTAGGRIDSPPTVRRGLAMFGCADGWVYCLRASDGQLAWRFQAAPCDRLIVAFGQLESAWRVHGSVLVANGLAYCTAGRSTFLDGGIRVVALDPGTGKVVHKTTLDTWSPTRDDAKDKPFIPGYHIEGALSDVLVSEGEHIYLGQYKLDRSLKRQNVPYALIDPKTRSAAMGLDELTGKKYVQNIQTQKKDEVVQRQWQLRVWPKMSKELKEKYGAANLGERTMGRHVFATGGFLDDSWYNRTFWMYSETWPGFHIANRGAKTGQLLVVGPEKTYAVQAYPYRNLQSPLFTPGQAGYLLFADGNDNEPILPDYTRGVPKGIGFTRKDPPVWFHWVPVRIRGMVLAGRHLFVAGAPDVVDAQDPMAAFEGRKGAVLRAYSASDGKMLTELKLAAPPVFDGMIATAGRLYVVMRNGTVICLAPKK